MYLARIYETSYDEFGYRDDDILFEFPAEDEAEARQYAQSKGYLRDEDGYSIEMLPIDTQPYRPYVNVYLVDRAYGGPEEGGWWFDYGDPVSSIRCDSILDVQKTLINRSAWCDKENASRPVIDSVASQGRYAVRVERKFAEVWPRSRPHYE